MNFVIVMFCKWLTFLVLLFPHCDSLFFCLFQRGLVKFRSVSGHLNKGSSRLAWTVGQAYD